MGGSSGAFDQPSGPENIRDSFKVKELVSGRAAAQNSCFLSSGAFECYLLAKIRMNHRLFEGDPSILNRLLRRS